MRLSKELPESGVRVMADRRDFGRFIGSAKCEHDRAACLGCLLSVLMFMVGAAVTAAGVTSDREVGTVGRFVGVGLLVLSVVVPLGTRVWQEWKGPPATVFHCFEHGFVLTHGPEVRALPWSEARVSSFREATYSPHGGVAEPVEWADIRTREGETLYAVGGEAAEQIAATAAADELPRAAHRLARGGTVAYGSFALSTEELFLDGTPLPWREVRQVESGSQAVRVYRTGTPDRAVHFTAPRRQTPYDSVVVALSQTYISTHRPRGPRTPHAQPPDCHCAPTGGPPDRADEPSGR